MEPRAPTGRGGAGRGKWGEKGVVHPPPVKLQLSCEGKGDVWGGGVERWVTESWGRGSRRGCPGLARGPTQGPKPNLPNEGRRRQGKCSSQLGNPRGGIQTPCLPHCLNHRVGRGPGGSEGAWWAGQLAGMPISAQDPISIPFFPRACSS